MPGTSYAGPNLPKTLLNQLGISEPLTKRRNIDARSHARGAERGAARSVKKGAAGQGNFRKPVERLLSENGSNSVHSGDKVKAEKPRKESSRKHERPAEHIEQRAPVVSKATKARLDDDDAEIAALEKKLGLKGKQTASRKAFQDDGLDFLLEDVEGSSDDGRGGKRKREDYEGFLANKRRRGLPEAQARTTRRRVSPDDSDGSVTEESESLGLNSTSQSEDSDDGDGLDDFGVSSETEEQKPATKRRENPYVAPVQADQATTKYVPPGLRNLSSSDGGEVARIKRQLQGPLNRLSHANMVTIIKDVEKVYATNARGFVSSTLIELLLGLLADKTRLNDTFIVLHAGFIAGLYKVIGVDFGAQIVERISSTLDASRKADAGIAADKTAVNLICTLAVLYVLNVIGSKIIFDHLRVLLMGLSEDNTELILAIVKTCGQSLRQDDPLALKDIVILLQKSASQVAESAMSVRTKFMIETINNLKNNRLKAGAGASATLTEHVERMKKTLNSLHARNGAASEPLRFGLEDMKSANKTGKWWLVGASWKGAASKASMEVTAMDVDRDEGLSMDVDDDGTMDLLKLAREQGMNTEIRRAIFVAIMSASDFEDARMRLLKLHLKKSQELEIPRVVNQCVEAEASYNPYYTLIARKLCSERRFMKAFQFGLWDIFKRMGERAGINDDGDESGADAEMLKTHQVVNFGRMYGGLVAHEALPLASLKKLEFELLKGKTKAFIEVLLTTLFVEAGKRGRGETDHIVERVFARVASEPRLAVGLQTFLSKLADGPPIVTGRKDRARFDTGLAMAREILMGLQSALQAGGAADLEEWGESDDSSE